MTLAEILTTVGGMLTIGMILGGIIWRLADRLSKSESAVKDLQKHQSDTQLDARVSAVEQWKGVCIEKVNSLHVRLTEAREETAKFEAGINSKLDSVIAAVNELGVKVATLCGQIKLRQDE